MAQKRKFAKFIDKEDNDEAAKIPKQISHLKKQEKRLIVVLEGANLEVIKVNDRFELLNCDDHIKQMRKHGKDPAHARPDITHQCLLMLFDSPLNRAGLLQVYVHSSKNALIEINPQTRIPRTFKRFAGLMVQLLNKMSVRAADSTVKLMKIIKNPISDHLPVGCRKLAMSFHASKVVHPRELVTDVEEPTVLVIGAMAHGSVDVDYIEGTFSISNYPLSGALACSKICSAFEEKWDIL
ncbi:ribosomal RNA small subunit methyltransferase NEP1 [Galendromus occidentalis]|uniref:18S rRNA (pseudouridine-N1)-methyltransferase n=1 Tax=Galendromus occidentalis TaxID=34638 RepID=A0AAJ7L386_9ACAR|nr:ribosomal RNA small subunit methyltransferase NEP1 [Galendromus occidentalis]